METIVTIRPEMLTAVRGSPKTIVATEMVRTSLKIPQMLRVTTEVRWSSANSEDTIRKAMTPGKRTIAVATITPYWVVRTPKREKSAEKPSTGMAMMKIETNITGARKKMEEKGLDVAGLRRRRTWVRDQRRPDRADAVMTRMKPRTLKCASPATIIITPTVMMEMMPTRRHVGCSRRKMKANIRTKAREDDLHMAKAMVRITRSVRDKGGTNCRMQER
jgi:hypothetical protein